MKIKLAIFDLGKVLIDFDLQKILISWATSSGAAESDILKKFSLDDVYEQFTEVVSQERGIDEINMQRLGNGRVFTGRQAFKANLVDALGTFEDARKALCITAGIPQNSQLQYPLEPRRSWWTILKDDVSSALPGWESSSSIKLQYRIPY